MTNFGCESLDMPKICLESLDMSLGPCLMTELFLLLIEQNTVRNMQLNSEQYQDDFSDIGWVLSHPKGIADSDSFQKQLIEQ